MLALWNKRRAKQFLQATRRCYTNRTWRKDISYNVIFFLFYRRLYSSTIFLWGLVLREKGYTERLLGESKKKPGSRSLFIASDYYLFEELWSLIL